ncbi:unnamed protein product [Polarella glacialis]|uniref:Uncharacterized protein n=1 Tax=Polarella glacialis TaxID=89957 RepID=A0A813ELN2_POLGL|nr:unnamed protein product [Polarella glacialis]
MPSCRDVLASLEKEREERRLSVAALRAQLEGLRRLERVSAAGADARRLSELAALHQEISKTAADLRCPVVQLPRSSQTPEVTQHRGSLDERVAGLTREVRHLHCELRRLDALSWPGLGPGEAAGLVPDSRASVMASLVAEAQSLRQLLKEQTAATEAAEQEITQSRPDRAKRIAAPAVAVASGRGFAACSSPARGFRSRPIENPAASTASTTLAEGSTPQRLQGCRIAGASGGYGSVAVHQPPRSAAIVSLAGSPLREAAGKQAVLLTPQRQK